MPHKLQDANLCGKFVSVGQSRDENVGQWPKVISGSNFKPSEKGPLTGSQGAHKRCTVELIASEERTERDEENAQKTKNRCSGSEERRERKNRENRNEARKLAEGKEHSETMSPGDNEVKMEDAGRMAKRGRTINEALCWELRCRLSSFVRR